MTQRIDETWHRLLNWTYGSTPSERLAGLVLLDQGYEDFDPTHPLGGPDGGKDALCNKDGKRWIMAVYFPRGQKSFNDISTKFKHDLEGVAKNGADGIVFVTNQELTESERTKLKDLGGLAAVEVYHLERLAILLDQPRMEKVRQQFLFIDPEQRSAAAEETATVQEPKKPGWVWRCTDESIAAGQISVLAVFEIFIAMGVYWWLVSHSPWPWMAFIGMVSAPLLLLRSEAAIVQGVELLRVFWNKDEKAISKKQMWFLGTVSAFVAGLLAYWLTTLWLLGHVGWALVWRSAVLGVVVVAIAVAVGTAVGAADAIAFAGAFVVAGRSEGVGVGAAVVALAGVGAGFVIRGFIIRAHATFANLPAGLAQLPQNWRETILTIDPWHMPELLPQAGTVSPDLSIKGLLARFNNKSKKDLLEKILFVGLIIPIYTSAIAYRWSLKASALLWFPLILALTPPLHQQTPQKTRKNMAVIHAWHLAYIGIASLVIVWMFSPLAALAEWKGIRPDWITAIAAKLPSPPTFGLNTFIACIAGIFTVLLVVRSRNFKASHGKVLESPNEFRTLDTADKAEFIQEAKNIDSIRLWLIGTVILWGYSLVAGMAYHRYPTEAKRFIWPWLLALL